jgi:hypothetical protein
MGDNSMILSTSVTLQDKVGVDKFVKQSEMQLNNHRTCETSCHFQIVICLPPELTTSNIYTTFVAAFVRPRDRDIRRIRDLGVCVVAFLDPVVGSDVNRNTLPIYYDPQNPHSMNMQRHMRNGDLVHGKIDQDTWIEWLE